jgi:hypothetical protein
MGRRVDVEEMAALFVRIQEAFPHLTMRLERDHPHLDLNMDIPRQAGLVFDVNVNLQGDELHLSAEAFWLEWFPCTEAEIVDGFRETVHGVLSGTFRIVEHLRGSRVVKAELQRPANHGWQTVGTWGRLHLPLGRRSTRVRQNAAR